MTKTLSMVSHKNYYLSANEDFFNIFDFQVIYMLYWRFHFENETTVNCLLTQWKWGIYWTWVLEDEVHSIWDLWISGLQECKGNGFFKVGRAGISFWSGPKNLDFLDERLLLPEYSSPEKFVRGRRLNVLPTSPSQIPNITQTHKFCNV